MTAYQRVAKRLANRGTAKRMTQTEANHILKGTTGYIWRSGKKFGWSARMAECGLFRSPSSAVNDILRYFKEGGY